MGGFDGVQFACLKYKGRKGCPASSTGRVSATLNIERCKSLPMRVRLHPESICSDMFVNGLAVTGRSMWFNSALCLFIGRTQALSSLVIAASRKGVLARMMPRWRVVCIALRGGSTSVMALQ